MIASRVGGFTAPCLSRVPQCLRPRAFQSLPKATVQRGVSSRSPRRERLITWARFKQQIGLAFTVVIGASLEQSRIAEKIDPIYPEPVAKELRRAVYYQFQTKTPVKAFPFYQKAIQKARELRIDRYSAAMMGIWENVALLLEDIQQYSETIRVLEKMLDDNRLWMAENGSTPGKEGTRTAVLKNSINCSAQLSRVYANDHVLEKQLAEERLIWSVETTMKEVLRREKEGVKPGEGNFYTTEQLGSMYEALAHNYEEKGQHYLAAPLFLQALNNSPPLNCHTVVLMNNLAISLAQQEPPPVPGQPLVSREALVANARLWAEKAVAVAAKIQPPERTEECDEGCVVATHNLGEMAEMDGNIAEARRKYEEAKSLAKAVGFKEGEMIAEEALVRVGNT